MKEYYRVILQSEEKSPAAFGSGAQRASPGIVSGGILRLCLGLTGAEG